MASKLTLRTVSLWSPKSASMHFAMSYSYPDVSLVGSVSLPSQKPGPGRLVTTERVSATTGVKPAAPAGTAPHWALADEGAVVLVEAAPFFPLLLHAERAT